MRVSTQSLRGRQILGSWTHGAHTGYARCKSTRTLAAQLTRQKHPVSHEKVAQLLREQNYSLQSNRKTEEGADHPDRDAQFRHINAQVKRALAEGMPVISVDTKKKELLGNYDNSGQQWLPAKKPVKVNGHDFPSPDVPRAYPYGIYDLARNTGFVNVGTDHDTGAFAVASVRGWWRSEGRSLYSRARVLLITADVSRHRSISAAHNHEKVWRDVSAIFSLPNKKQYRTKPAKTEQDQATVEKIGP